MSSTLILVSRFCLRRGKQYLRRPEGLGINLDNTAPTTCVNRVIAERLAKAGLAAPAPLTRERLLGAFMTRFEALAAGIYTRPLLSST
jgi:hypothetical protein